MSRDFCRWQNQPGIIDQDIQRPKMGRGLLHGIRDLRLLRAIRRNAEYVTAGPAYFSRHALQGRCVDIKDGHPGAFIGE